jgi:DNA topoisomerase-1
MTEKIVIVESPNKAKEFGRMAGLSGRYRFMATAGHFRDLPRDELGMSIGKSGAAYKLEIAPDKREMVRKLRSLCRNAEVLVATDDDREGETIGSHLADILRGVTKQIARIKIRAITEKEFLAAAKKPGALDMNFVAAGVTRRLIDRWIGYGLSAPVAKALGLAPGGTAVGRTQTTGLRLIHDREKEIAEFVPKPFWKVQLLDGKGTVFVSGNIDSEAAAQETGAVFRERGGVVGGVKMEMKKDTPPPPLTASTLQQYCARLFKWSAEESMRTAQELFEGPGSVGEGVITYHRTDSVRMAPETVEEVRAWIGKRMPELLPAKPPVYRNKSNAQDAHECIHPVHLDSHHEPQALAGKMTDDQARLYELIWKVFLASQCKPAEWETTEITLSARGASHDLVAKGRRLVFPGWRSLGLPALKEAGDKLIEGSYAQGQHVSGEVEVRREMTKPPTRYNEASFIKELERRGIGRPSTYAEIVGKQFARGDVTCDEKGFYHLEPIGRKKIELLLATCPRLVDVDYTARMEEALDRISLGEIKAEVGRMRSSSEGNSERDVPVFTLASGGESPLFEVRTLVDEALESLSRADSRFRVSKEEALRAQEVAKEWGRRRAARRGGRSGANKPGPDASSKKHSRSSSGTRRRSQSERSNG